MHENNESETKSEKKRVSDRDRETFKIHCDYEFSVRFFPTAVEKNVLLILFAFHVQDLWLNLINNRNTDHTGKEDKRRKKYLFRAWYEWVVKMTSIWIEEWTSAKARNGSDYEPNDGKIVNRVQTRFKFKRIKREREKNQRMVCYFVAHVKLVNSQIGFWSPVFVVVGPFKGFR